MTIHFEIPKDIEERLRAAGIDLTQMAKEALLVDLYRQHKITHRQLGEALGLDRFDTDVLLKRHGVELELSLEEFNAEVAPERPTPAEVSSVTLRDHFRPPLGTQRHWHSFHSAWATAIAAGLNQRLPEGYFAEPNVQFGIEIDVATFEETGPSAPSGTSPLAGGLDSGWSAPAPVRTIPLALLTDMVEVQIFTKEGGPTLVGAVELVSPANKDRAAHRDAFVSKCAAYLQQAVGLAIVDVVTERLANLHDELLARVGEPVASGLGGLYAAAYRPVERDGQPRLEVWQEPLAVGRPLPVLPLWLRGGLCLPLDLPAAYTRACQDVRLPLS